MLPERWEQPGASIGARRAEADKRGRSVQRGRELFRWTQKLFEEYAEGSAAS